jgi:formylmethanofuran dehydrogenase subunit E
MSNAWPGGYRHAMHQHEHEAWNAHNYPGTRQLCSACGEPTGRCTEDELANCDGEPLCESCYGSDDFVITSQPRER